MKTAKKTNNAGFTLIELIVVMAIMSIIMGAILNFIRPTATLYSTTNAYLNQEEAVSSIYNVLNDDLTYATDVYVVLGDSDDPMSVNDAAQEVKDQLVNLGQTPIQFKNCLVLDNETIRDATSEAKAKHATGSVYKYALTDTLNLKYTDVTKDPSLIAGEKIYTNYFALENLAFMDDYKFLFTVTAPLSGEEQVLTLTTEVLAPTYDSDTREYVFTEHHFSSDNSIEFININSGAATSNCKLATSEASTPFIYIFYNRRDKIPENTVDVKFECYVLDSTGSDYKKACDFTSPTGSDITQKIIEKAESNNTIEPVSDTHVFYRTGLYSTTPNDLYVDGKVYYDLTNVQGSGIVKLYAVYKKEPKAAVLYNVNVYTSSDKTVLQTTYPKSYGESLSLTPPAPPTGYAGGYYAICGSQIKADLDNIKNDMDIYPYYYKNYKVEFQLEDGTAFKGGAFDIDEVQQDTTIGMPEGLLESVVDTANSVQYSYELVKPDVFLETITGDKVIKIKETAVTISASSDLEGSVGRQWNGDHYVIHLNNKSNQAISAATITIVFDSNISSLKVTGDNAAFKVQSVSGNTAVIKYVKTQQGWNISIPANSNYTGDGLTVELPSAANISEIRCTIN